MDFNTMFQNDKKIISPSCIFAMLCLRLYSRTMEDTFGRLCIYFKKKINRDVHDKPYALDSGFYLVKPVIVFELPLIPLIN